MIQFSDFGPELFRMFAGGTAVLWDGVHFCWREYRDNRPFLIYGTVLKYWAFVISVHSFISTHLSLQVLLLFGGGNLVFAVLFTYYQVRPNVKT